MGMGLFSAPKYAAQDEMIIPSNCIVRPRAHTARRFFPLPPFPSSPAVVSKAGQ